MGETPTPKPPSEAQEPESPDTTAAAPPVSEIVDHEAEERAWAAACARLKIPPEPEPEK